MDSYDLDLEGGGHHPIASLHRRRVPILRGAPTQNLEKRKEDEHSDYLPSLDVKFCIKMCPAALLCWYGSLAMENEDMT